MFLFQNLVTRLCLRVVSFSVLTSRVVHPRRAGLILAIHFGRLFADVANQYRRLYMIVPQIPRKCLPFGPMKSNKKSPRSDPKFCVNPFLHIARRIFKQSFNIVLVDVRGQIRNMETYRKFPNLPPSYITYSYPINRYSIVYQVL